MEADGLEIRTPFEYPYGYSVSWRNDIATIAVDTPGGSYPTRPDEYIRMQVAHLRDGNVPAYERAMSKIVMRADSHSDQRCALVIANGIFQRASTPVAKEKLEALLLCPELDLNTIADLMSMDVMVVKLYERIFYQVRDDEGKSLLSPWLREFFARDGIDNDAQQPRALDAEAPGEFGRYWKALAFEGGHKVLFTLWQWPISLTGGELAEAETHMVIFRRLIGRLDQRVRYGTLDGRSSVQLMDGLRAHMTDMRDRGVMSRGEGSSTDTIVYKILQSMGPAVIVPDKDQLMAAQEDLQTKIAMIRQTNMAHQGESRSTMDHIGSQMAAKGD